MSEVKDSSVIYTVDIPSGDYCRRCRFLTDCSGGYCFLYGYLKYYDEKKLSFKKSNGCKRDFPNSTTIYVVKGEENKFEISEEDDDNL